MRSLKKACTVQLQERDIAVLRGLFESRVMTAAHICALYFDDHAEMTKKRLQRLTAAGLVSRHPDTLIRPTPFILAPGGLAELRRRGIHHEYPCFDAPSLERRSRVSPLTIRHELEVMDVKAAFTRAARKAGIRILEFTTWPLLNQFPDGRGSTVKPDGFIRIEERQPDGTTQQHSLFLELDRSTESKEILVDRARAYANHFRSGRFAEMNGGTREDFRRYPFRALFILQTAEQRNNTIERLLACSPPILAQVWLTTIEEITSNPLGAIWITPAEYRTAIADSGLDTSRRSAQWGYKRQTAREALVERTVPKQSLVWSKRSAD